MKIQQNEAQYLEQLKNKLITNSKKKHTLTDNFSPILKGRKAHGRTPAAVGSKLIPEKNTKALIYGENFVGPSSH